MFLDAASGAAADLASAAAAKIAGSVALEERLNQESDCGCDDSSDSSSNVSVEEASP
jgi:hypothetical protein